MRSKLELSTFKGLISGVGTGQGELGIPEILKFGVFLITF